MRNSKGQFVKGTPKPEGSGRKKGTKDKAAAFGEAALLKIVQIYYDSGLMDKDLAALDPKERIRAIIALLPYIVPRKASTTVDMTVAPEQTLTQKLIELAQEYT